MKAKKYVTQQNRYFTRTETEKRQSLKRLNCVLRVEGKEKELDVRWGVRKRVTCAGKNNSLQEAGSITL